jgi:hypothetical protein
LSQQKTKTNKKQKNWAREMGDQYHSNKKESLKHPGVKAA